MCKVFTVGYEGKTIDKFIELLKQHNIQQIIDVREIPLSRKPGFSKTALANRLDTEGISYIHIKGLGSPQNIRKELHQTHDYDKFFQEYKYYIGTHVEYIQEAWEYFEEKQSCLLCFENLSSECHRSIIAAYMKEIMPDVGEVINI